MVLHLSLDEARRAWASAQGLGTRRTGPLRETLAATGWLRMLGGAEAYLGMLARAEDATAEAVHAAIAAGDLRVLPAVRGCLYLVPREDTAIAIAIASENARRSRPQQQADIDIDEFGRAREAICEALTAGERSTTELCDASTAGSSRGRMIALRDLELTGQVVRRPEHHRLDRAYYRWCLCLSPADEPPPSGPVLHQALLERFFRWAGPSTAEAFRAWSGLSGRDTKEALRHGSLREVDIDGLPPMLTQKTPATDPLPARVVLLPAVDNLWALPETGAALVEPQHANIEVGWFGRPSAGPLAETSHPSDRTVAIEGRIAGLWAWDPDLKEVVLGAFQNDFDPESVLDERRRVQGLFEALGHGRAFTLDDSDVLRERCRRARAVAGRT